MNTALQQRRAALIPAQRVRLRRVEVCRQIANLPAGRGRQMAVAVMSDPDPDCAGMAIYRLLLACRGIGHPTATRLLARVPVSQSRPLCDLTDRQRRRIHELLKELS